MPLSARAPNTAVNEKRLAANRLNARNSTGPRSRHGKARARVNALKHGLAAVMCLAETDDSDVAVLAQRLLNGRNNPHLVVCATAFARAEIQIQRTREVKLTFMQAALQQHADACPLGAPAIATLDRIDRYECRARARRTKAFWKWMSAIQEQRNGLKAGSLP